MNEKSLIAAGNDGWDVVPADSSEIIRGSISRFKDGTYYIGRSLEPANGRELIVSGVLTLWVKWAGGKPVDHRITRAQQRHPERDELPDQDESLWEPGFGDRLADPWQDTRHLFLIDPHSAEEITFVTNSAGGKKAIADLKNQISNVRYAHPRATPVVRLAAELWKTQYGMKPKPLFQVIGWKAAGDVSEPVQQITAKQVDDGLGKPAHDDMNDEVPF